MTKSEFTGTLTDCHRKDNKEGAIVFLNTITKLSMELATKLIQSLWGCSAEDSFGENLYELLEVSANGGDFVPKLRTNECGIYIMYLDEHTAGFVLYKILNT